MIKMSALCFAFVSSASAVLSQEEELTFGVPSPETISALSDLPSTRVDEPDFSGLVFWGLGGQIESLDERLGVPQAPEIMPGSVISPSLQTGLIEGAEYGLHLDRWALDGWEPRIPFGFRDSLIIQLAPNTTREKIHELISDYEFEVVETYPSLGQMHVLADLSEFIPPELRDNGTNEAVLEAMISAGDAFSDHPSILAATPDFFLHSQNNRPLFSVTQFSKLPDDSEVIDWGLRDIGAEQLWNEKGAHDGVQIGIMDEGFNRHEDLVFLDWVEETPISNHGNHVAGIACARHDGRGLKGVLPNCHISARAFRVYPVALEGETILQFLTTFSDVISSLNEFLSDRSDLRIFNVSLGYNWMPNHGINPDRSNHANIRQLVDQQGRMLIVPLMRAAETNTLIVSAAGNDSSSLDSPMSARYASPFNWASFVALKRGGPSTTLIVEAHGQDRERAAFSNIDGHISCPGVGIISTVAMDEGGSSSESIYGTMSGTSMASPYCASGALLFSLVRPKYKMTEVRECLLDSARNSSTGAPQLSLKSAIDDCPRR